MLMVAGGGDVLMARDCVDLFHPLATLQWTEHTTIPDFTQCSNHCVCLNDRIYVVASTTGYSKIILLSFSLDFKECVRLSLPVESFALSHYQSQLVLVGEEKSYNNPSNELWVSDDGINWKQSLPPRRVKRGAVSVVNTSSPECLVIVGGFLAGGSKGETTVEVFVKGEWFIAQNLPTSLEHVKCYVHCKTVIVAASYEPIAYCCHLESLLASCIQSEEDDQVKPSSNSVWRKFDYPNCASYNFSFSSILSFRQQLVAIADSSVYMLCPATHTWLKLGNLPAAATRDDFCISSAVLSTGELLIIPVVDISNLVVCTASLKISQSYAEEVFSISALQRLEMAGFKLYKSMAKVYKKVAAAVGVVRDVRDDISPEKSVANLFEYWLLYRDHLHRPPIWGALLGMLSDLGMGELSQQIKDYLFCGGVGAPSLWELSMAVVMSGMIQQRLEPDQLHTKLPDYIPTTLRDTIVHSFKERTLQLVPFPCLTPDYYSSPDSYSPPAAHNSSRLSPITSHSSSPSCSSPSPRNDTVSLSPSSISTSAHTTPPPRRQRNLRRFPSSSTEHSHGSSGESSSSLDEQESRGMVGYKEPSHWFHSGIVQPCSPPEDLVSSNDEQDKEKAGSPSHEGIRRDYVSSSSSSPCSVAADDKFLPTIKKMRLSDKSV